MRANARQTGAMALGISAGWYHPSLACIVRELRMAGTDACEPSYATLRRWRLSPPPQGSCALEFQPVTRAGSYIDSSRWKNDRYRVNAIRRSSVETLSSPFIHWSSSVERSRLNTSVNRVTTWDTSASACSTAARG